ncbi:hypothetical protein D3C72_470180 [compost metagenome]
MNLEGAPPQPGRAEALAPVGVGLALGVDVVAPGLDGQTDGPDAEAEQKRAAEQIQRQAGPGENDAGRRQGRQRIGYIHQAVIALQRPRQPAQGDDEKDAPAASDPDEQGFTQQGRGGDEGAGEGDKRRGHHDVVPCFATSFLGHGQKPDRSESDPGEGGQTPSIRSHECGSFHDLHKKTCKHGSLAQASFRPRSIRSTEPGRSGSET